MLADLLRWFQHVTKIEKKINILTSAYSLPSSFRAFISSGTNVLCPAAWVLTPTTCTSESTAS